MKSLKDRLSGLRRQSAGQPLSQITPPGRAGLAERIGRMRPAAGPCRKTTEKWSDEGLAELLQGEVVAPGVIIIEKRLTLSARHGDYPLARLLTCAHHLPEANGAAVESFLFIDTETTGLSGGSGTVVFLLGMGRLQGDNLIIRQYLITSFAGEPAMLDHAAAWITGSGHLVSFNGKAFDIPLLTARSRLSRRPFPCDSLPHIDLLHPARRAYGSRWGNCRLQTAEQKLLKFFRRHDLPGSEAPESWFSFLRRGDASRLPLVAKHNYLDILSLAALLPALAEAHHDPLRWQADIPGIARAHLRQGNEGHAYLLLSGHEPQLDRRGQLELARLHRSRGNLDAALSLWERLARKGCRESLERLAIYYEHEAKDYGHAYFFAAQLPPGDDAIRRTARLMDKMGRQAFKE